MNPVMYNLVVDGTILICFTLLCLFAVKHGLVLVEEILEKVNRVRKLQR